MTGLRTVSFAGCSNKEADKSKSNELVLFNAKGENEAEFEQKRKEAIHLEKQIEELSKKNETLDSRQNILASENQSNKQLMKLFCQFVFY